ncbi:hypothetical protein OG320_22675 [Microbispora sp. NBC_01189]|uniref:trypsin-like serine peptidase n=1 Tax=Microbispora sp. NBC_01189 TaxID=2903583 RepID=UPI002E0DC1D4|nr:hypothetical protein OG320_22675 [Microbispora sp. NBC_01189]
MTPSLPLLAVTLLAAGLVRGPGPAVPPSQGPVTNSVTNSVTDPVTDPVTDVVEHAADHTSEPYWTPQRMARAVPIGLLAGLQKITALPPPVLAPDAARPAVRTGTFETGGAGGATRTRQAAMMPPATTSGTHWAAGGSVTRTTGRVFLTMNGVDFVCSASAVRSANRDVVVTAGHCVKDGSGAWAENWTFVPGYDQGRQPYGVFPARRMFVAGPWSRSGNDDYDVGMVAVDDQDGRHLTDVVGGQPLGFDTPQGRRTYGFGFPADPPYDGERLLYCAGMPHGDPQGQTRDQGLRCDLTAGASGGPWLSGFDPGSGRGTLTSVSSFKYSNDQRTMYGPHFGSAVRDLFRGAEQA